MLVEQGDDLEGLPAGERPLVLADDAGMPPAEGRLKGLVPHGREAPVDGDPQRSCQLGSAVNDGEDAPAPEPDARIQQVAMRAKAAGLEVWWTRFTNPATGRGEGPRGIQIDLRAGRNGGVV